MKHLDTLDIEIAVKPEVKEKIKSKLTTVNDTVYGVGGACIGEHPSGLYSFFYICMCYILIVKVKHIAMVGINSAEVLQEQLINMITEYFEINRDDIVEVINIRDKNQKIKIKTKKGKEISRIIGGQQTSITDIAINRSEYKNDYKTKNEDEILAIQDIQRISAEKYYSYEQFLYDYSENNNSRINSVYAKDGSGYVAITGYFKEYEQSEKENPENAEKYKGIFRTEVKLKNGHLNYKKDSKQRDKTLKSYFDENVAKEYFEKYAQKIYYTEPFFRIDVAISKIYESKKLKEYMKIRLGEFLTRINEVGITESSKKYNPRTFRNYIKKVREMGINPLCFSRYIDGKEIETRKMDNFIMFENSIDEDI